METGLRSIASHCVNNEDNDSFSKVVKTYTSVQNRFRIIEPIIEELHDIIESTLSALGKNCSVSGNSRSGKLLMQITFKICNGFKIHSLRNIIIIKRRKGLKGVAAKHPISS